jgi:Insertion element 4 transposase N-terminal/Transposase DDE domain
VGFILREMDAERKFAQELTLDAIGRAVPLHQIQAALQDENAQATRERKLNMVVVVLVVIAMSLYPYFSIEHVLKRVAQGLRFIWPDPEYPVPKDNAFTYRRYQLNARPMVALFHRVCRPIATPQTPGAFLFGMRLVAIDSTVEDVPDTPENAAAFGRHHGDRGDGAFPQVRGVYLVECGPHTIIEAGFWPLHTSERVGGFRLLRALEPGMLLLWDRGFHDYDMFAQVLQRQAQALGRFSAQGRPKLVCPLPDGSYLAYIYPSEYRRRQRGEHLLVRVIEYTIVDPGQPGYGEVHRLMTTLLDPEAYPAEELACAYHERWEIELVIDEVDSHQRLARRPLRSHKPVGVIQELYGLVIAHYAVRFLMHEAALQAGIDPDRLSFVETLRVIGDAVPEFQMISPEQWPRLYGRLLHDIAAERLPERRLRSNPRVVKRKMSNFRLKRAEHAHWPQPTMPFRKAVAIQKKQGKCIYAMAIRPKVPVHQAEVLI